MTEVKRLHDVKNGEIFRFARISHILEESFNGFERLRDRIYNLDTGRRFLLNSRRSFSHMNTKNSRKVVVFSEGPGPNFSKCKEMSKDGLGLSENFLTVLKDSNAFLGKEFITYYEYDHIFPSFTLSIEGRSILKFYTDRLEVFEVGSFKLCDSQMYKEEFFTPVVMLVQLAVNNKICS